jgi:hypothetical protein
MDDPPQHLNNSVVRPEGILIGLATMRLGKITNKRCVKPFASEDCTRFGIAAGCAECTTKVSDSRTD